MPQTVTICIGNSDDKLSQSRWASYVIAVETTLTKHYAELQFSGFSTPAARWQNAAWVFIVKSEEQLASIKQQLQNVCQMFEQESIAIVVGDTEFITPPVSATE